MTNYLSSLYIILCTYKLCYLILNTDSKIIQNKKSIFVLKNYKNLSNLENKHINSQITKQYIVHNTPVSNTTDKNEKSYESLNYTKQVINSLLYL